MKCYFHSDADGAMSAAIVADMFPDVELYPVQYGKDYSKLILDIEDDETVYVLDFCFSKDIMEALNVKADLIWIDHHTIVLQEEINTLNIKGVRDINHAACVLTWDYFHPNENTPVAVTLIGLNDVGEKDSIEATAPLTAVVNSEFRLPSWKSDKRDWYTVELAKWISLIKMTSKDVEAFVAEHKGYHKHEAFIRKMYNLARTHSYEGTFLGRPAIIANISGVAASFEFFGDFYDDSKYTFAIRYRRTKEVWKLDVLSYDPDIHVGQLLIEQFGEHKAGGHENVGGVTTEDILEIAEILQSK